MDAWRAWASPLPVEVVALLLFDAVAAMFSVLAWAFPMSAQAPVHLDLASGLVAVAMTVLNVRLAWALPTWVLHGELLAGAGLLEAIVARSHTVPGAGVAAIGLLGVVVYVALFCSARAVAAYTGATFVGLAFAYRTSGLRVDVRAWLAVVAALGVTVAALARLVRRLRSQADVDQLTGLLNRRAMRCLAERQLARAARDGRPVTLVVLDIDGLKTVNDTLGHPAGDELLVGFAAAVSSVLRPGEAAARYGGDEFLLLLPRTGVEGVQAAMSRLHAIDTRQWSAGAAEWRSGEDYDSWFERADAALYRAKSAR